MKLIALFALAASLCAQDIQGLWQGTIDTGGTKLRLVLHVDASPGGRLTGKLDSIDQGQLGIPISDIAVKGREVTLSMKNIGASYSGTLNAVGDEISGQWSQGGGSIGLIFRRVDQVPEVTRPQNPKPPFPYEQEEVIVVNTTANVKLAGTLTLPRGTGPFPAAVLITGSGPQDRDETIMGHRPFLVIADHLTRNGIAVLRVDDRGVAKSTGSFAKATSADFATDTRACVMFLQARTDIDKKRVGLIGHSEGGIIAPLVASQDPTVAFVVLMAGPGVPGDQVVAEQQVMLAKAMGVPGEVQAANREIQEKLVAILRRENDRATAEKQMRAVIAEALQRFPEEQRQAIQPIAESQIQQSLMPDARYFMTYDPGPALRKLKCPVLAMNGAIDLQVSASQNLPAIARALEDGGNSDYEIVKLPRLNHLFQTAGSGAPAEYASIPETISPLALNAMTEWLNRHVTR